MLRSLIICTMLGLLGSCTATTTGKQGTAGATARAQSAQKAPASGQGASAPTVDVSAALSTSAADLAASKSKESQRVAPTIYRGNDRQVRLPAVEEPVRFLGDDVSLNFEQAPLSEVMHAIMGDILQLDYIVDHPIKGQVTLRTRTPVPRDELLEILESLLRANKALMIRGSDGRYLVTGAQEGSKLSPDVSSQKNTGAGYSTIIVPLRYISASNMAEILQPVADEKAFVRVDNARSLLMLAGTREQLDGWLDMVATFDVDLLKGMSVGLFPLENSGVEEVAEALSVLLNDGGQDEKRGALAKVVRVVPVKRLNSILIVTPRSHYLDTVGTWIERLDGLPDSKFERRLYVYPVQNTSAGRLAELLNRIYADEFVEISGSRSVSNSGERGGGDGRRAGVAPGMSAETLGAGSLGIGKSSFSAPTSTGSGGSISSIGALADMGGGASSLENVRVVADEDNNALLIHATGKQYGLIKTALEQLDVVATQVLIEASILEVSLTDELRYGLEWSFNNNLGDDYDGVGVLAAAAGGPVAIAPGFSYSVINSAGNIKAVLNALSEQSLINVISTPSVMVLDNHTAYIHVGDQVPTFDQQTESDAGRITQSVVYKDTGVKLTVTPSVNAGGLVTMDVEQSVTDIGPIDTATGQRAFNERNIMSRVAVRSNESVVLGGLIRENATNTESGIPFLHQLPILGPLFGSTAKDDRRTELLVIITPRALYSENELREVSDEMRSQIRHMELITLPTE
ncbi:MAG: type II secretion system protein GspD [Gammaproteobacteria bacterium]|nr:MAG: type II secretion system protein GspD [Gammaproteobacteria bacterium]